MKTKSMMDHMKSRNAMQLRGEDPNKKSKVVVDSSQYDALTKKLGRKPTVAEYNKSLDEKPEVKMYPTKDERYNKLKTKLKRKPTVAEYNKS